MIKTLKFLTIDRVAHEDQAPSGHENNWVQTVPGKGWNILLRLYGPLEPWLDKTWRPGEFELVK
jgi:hypothetical protein